MSGVKINIDEIPPIENRLLGKSVFEYVKRFYENPDNVKGFKEWQKMRRKQGYGPNDTRNLDSTFKALAQLILNSRGFFLFVHIFIICVALSLKMSTF